eukprot:916639-Prorocentrum_minimum.AAC.1
MIVGIEVTVSSAGRPNLQPKGPRRAGRARGHEPLPIVVVVAGGARFAPVSRGADGGGVHPLVVDQHAVPARVTAGEVLSQSALARPHL